MKRNGSNRANKEEKFRLGMEIFGTSATNISLCPYVCDLRSFLYGFPEQPLELVR